MRKLWLLLLISTVSLSCADSNSDDTTTVSTTERLDGLIAQIPDFVNYQDVEHSPEAILALQQISRDDALTNELFHRVEAAEKINDDVAKMLWVASQLKGGSEYICDKLESSDGEMQGTALTLVARERLNPSNEQYLALLKSENPKVAEEAVGYAMCSHDDVEFFLQAAQSSNDRVARCAFGSASREVKEALLPLLVERLRKISTDEELLEAAYLLERLNDYDRVHFRPFSLKERDWLLQCHDELQQVRNKWKQKLEEDY